MKGLPDQQFTLQWIPVERTERCCVLGCENEESGNIVIKSEALDLIFVTPYRSCSEHNREVLMLVGQLLTVVDTDTLAAVGQMVAVQVNSESSE